MKGHGRQVLAAATALAIVGFGCGAEEKTMGDHQIWFMGSIYDGATGQILTGYEISLAFGPNTIKGKVDGNGRYTIGPLKAWNDYAVTISAPYYRPFVSYNAGIAPPTRPTTPGGSNSQTTNVTADDIYSANTSQTFDFDAYLFPADLAASPLTVSVIKTDPSPTPPDGTIRLRPTSLPSIQDQASGVSGQVWANDQDMLASVISAPFYGGSIMIDPAQLVYGVMYSITVYGVAGYQTGSTTVRAGFQDSAIVNISTTASPLVVVSNTISGCKPYGQSTNVRTTAQVSFTFNTSSIEDVTTSLGKGPEVLDAGLQVMTALGGTLKPNASQSSLERATSFILNGNTLSFSWDPSMGLSTPISGDTINYVIYSGLSSIMLQPTGHPEFVKSLATLINMSAINCGS